LIRGCLKKHRGLVKHILGNAYLSDTFWRNPDDPKALGHGAEAANRLNAYFKSDDCTKLLDEITNRLFLLRGQLVHGASTQGGKHNRESLRHGTCLLGHLVAVVLHIMIEHGCHDD